MSETDARRLGRPARRTTTLTHGSADTRPTSRRVSGWATRRAMDGYAVRAADLGDGRVPIAFRLAAGDPPQPLPAGAAAGIATGAPMPPGGDAVVPVEDAEEVGGSLQAAAPQVGAHIRRAGGDVEEGDIIARAGRTLTPALLAAIAAVGTERVRVARRPRLAAISTGSELVRPGAPLGPGEIYESNLTALVAQATRAGAEVTAAEIVHDDRAAIEAAFAGALGADVVVSSGGVSVGPHDHVKPALDALGVREVFWRVAHKPGKPLWFGVAPAGALVFGLPGNPVSSLVCFELFVRPALRRLAGHAAAGPHTVEAVLGGDFTYNTDRPTYYPVRLETAGTTWQFRPCPWFGSPDLRGLSG